MLVCPGMNGSPPGRGLRDLCLGVPLCLIPRSMLWSIFCMCSIYSSTNLVMWSIYYIIDSVWILIECSPLFFGLQLRLSGYCFSFDPPRIFKLHLRINGANGKVKLNIYLLFKQSLNIIQTFLPFARTLPVVFIVVVLCVCVCFFFSSWSTHLAPTSVISELLFSFRPQRCKLIRY